MYVTLRLDIHAVYKGDPCNAGLLWEIQSRGGQPELIANIRLETP